MSEQDTNNQPAFSIQRIYLKDLSVELPNAPKILLEQGNPQVDIQLNIHAENVVEGMYEVAVSATVTTKVTPNTSTRWGSGASASASRFMPRKPVVMVPIRPKMVTTVRRTTVLAWRRMLSVSR